MKDKCTVRLERLEECGHELTRPEAAYLRDDIYELRIKCQSVNYRILYFSHGRQIVVLSHGVTKQRPDVPQKEIDKAIERKKEFVKSPSKHTFEE
jgi:phage-related protein